MDYINRQQISAHNTAVDILNEMKKECTTFGELAEKADVFITEVSNAGKHGHGAVLEALYEVLRNEPLAPSKELPTLKHEERQSLDIESILEEMIIEFREMMKDSGNRMKLDISEEIRVLVADLINIRNHHSIICVQPQMLED